ncbi:hypothetical protein [Leucobacter luti]|uniref:hypothetical protein n=1 Tax=Leucobacter luti TaxID=340320 RepID=UPI003D01E003
MEELLDALQASSPWWEQHVKDMTFLRPTVQAQLNDSEGAVLPYPALADLVHEVAYGEVEEIALGFVDGRQKLRQMVTAMFRTFSSLVHEWPFRVLKMVAPALQKSCRIWWRYIVDSRIETASFPRYCRRSVPAFPPASGVIVIHSDRRRLRALLGRIRETHEELSGGATLRTVDSCAYFLEHFLEHLE